MQLKLNNDLQPLTYLALISLNEKVSNAAGYYNANKQCVKLKKREIDAGYKSDCDTENNPNTGLGNDSAPKWLAQILNLDSTAKDNPDNALAQNYVDKQREKGSTKTTEELIIEYAKTDEGRMLLNKIGSWAAPLFGKQEAPTQSSNTNMQVKGKPRGLTATQIVLLSVGGLFLIAGIGVGIYYYSVHKKNKLAQV